VSHGGIVPKETLIVRGFGTANFTFGEFLPPLGQQTGLAITGGELVPGTTLHQVRLDPSIDPFGPGAVSAVNYYHVVSGSNLQEDQIPPNNSLTGFSVFSSESDGRFASTPDDKIPLPSQPTINSHVVPSVTARSQGQFVDVKGGVVVLGDMTVSVGNTQATQQYFANKLSSTEYTGSVLAVLASQAGGFAPAYVNLQDRALGVLDGGRVNGSGNVALLTVLDSRLRGPTVTGAGRLDGSIPPLLELDSATTTNSSVSVKSAVVVRYTNASFGALDGALLEASSPILAMNYGSMTTSGHFADFSTNGKVALNANLPASALVVLNNNSNLTIGTGSLGGNLFNLNNAKASVTAALFSIGTNSTLTINGVLISLRGNSLLTLNSPTLGVLGQNSRLVLNNNLCSTSCKTLGVGEGSLRVAGGGTLELPASGFSAFLSVDGKATNSNGSQRVVLSQGNNTAHFFVETGSTLKIVAPK
jgi:hypothetical protein